MKLLNKKENQNKLFSRREIELIVENEVVPSHADAKEIIQNEFKVNENLIRVKRIIGKFGTKEFSITADIYNSQEEFNRVVKRTKQEIEKEKKAEEARKEEAKAAQEESEKLTEERKVE